MAQHWIGIDIAKQTLDLAIWDGQHNTARYLCQVSNDAAGFAEAQALLRAKLGAGSYHCVLEATGGYEKRWLAFAAAQGWACCLPNPKQVRDFARMSGRRNKNDRQDAALLASFGGQRQPGAQQPVAAEIDELDELLQRRAQLGQQLRRERNRLAQWQQRPRPTRAVVESMKRTIGHLQQEQDEIEAAIKQLQKDNPQTFDAVRTLLTLPGVGHKVVLPLLVTLHRFQARTSGAGNGKAFVAYLGLDPTDFQSGTSIHKRSTISRMGNSRMRMLLYMGALGGVRADNPLRVFYTRLVGRGKAKRLALTAAARKIACWAFAVFVSGVPFDPARHAIMPQNP